MTLDTTIHSRSTPLFFGLLILLGGLGTVDSLHAQSATFTGRVDQAAAGTPLPGATVVLRDPASGQRRHGTATDSTGAFALRDVQPGRYRLVVRFVGYDRHTETLTLPSGDTVRDTISLQRRALSQSELVVTTRRARPQVNPVTVSNLSAETVDRRLGVQDLPSLLSETPSTTFHSQNGNGIGYSTLRIRGVDQRRLAVSINGVPQNDPEDFNVFWVNLYGMQSSIEDVQVQRGAGSSLYGSVGIGGAINIVTDPFEPEPYALLDASLTYEAPSTTMFEALQLQVNANNLLDARVLRHGFQTAARPPATSSWSCATSCSLARALRAAADFATIRS